MDDWDKIRNDVVSSFTIWACAFFMIFQLVVNYLLMYLFVAIMVDGFTSDPEVANKFKASLLKAKEVQTQINALTTQEILISNTIQNNSISQKKQCLTEPCKKKYVTQFFKRCLYHKWCNNTNRVIPLHEVGRLSTIDPQIASFCESHCDAFFERIYYPVNENASLLFTLLKTKCTFIMNDKIFTWLTNFSIFLTIVTMLAGTHNNTNPQLQNVFAILLIVLTAIFTFEMIVKIVSLTLYTGHTAYIRSVWNRFDGVLTLLSLVDLGLFYNSHTLPSNRTTIVCMQLLRCSRSLRPLRLIQKSKRMQKTVETLLFSVRPITNIIFVGSIIVFIYALLGVQLLQGALHYCSIDENLDQNLFLNITTKKECLEMNATWVNHHYNFDNFISACLSLFVVITRNGWSDILYSAIDSVGPDMVPIVNYRPVVALYFVSFMLIVGYFVINMFVGVIVENFQLTMSLDTTYVQTEIQQAIMSPVPNGKLREFFHKLVCRKYFDHTFAAIICINVMVISIEHYGQSNELTNVLMWLDCMFSFMYTFEVFAKIMGTSSKFYFSQYWNRFEFVVSFTSAFSTIISVFSLISVNPVAFSIMRVFRVFKILKQFPGVNSLLHTVQGSAKHAINLGLLVALIFMVYASIGVELFAQLNCSVSR